MIALELAVIALAIYALTRTVKQGFELMANAIADLVTAFNDNTNAVAARIDRLLAAQANTATPEQLAELQAISDHLKALGADAANPVPTAPPVAG